jgi:steroid 5-alpha reductase family enzyme
MTFSGATLATAALASLVAVAVLVALTAWWSRRAGRVSVVDTVWGLFFVVIGWSVAAVAGFTARSLLLAVLATLWGVRLAWHIHVRSRGHGEDFRYAAMMRDIPEADRFAWALKRVFITQGVIAWFIGLPLTVAASTDRPLGLVAWVGLAVWAVGLTFEAVGDAQLRAFKADPANKGRIMDRGLWAWTRHPNYFGDATVWWGLWLIAAEAWPGVLTILSPIAMTYFLAFRTGAKLLERTMAQRPGYPEYMERTSGFFPLPPKRSR